MKVWIVDRWKYASGPNRGQKNPATWGKGLRWRVVWLDPTTRKEKSRAFEKAKGVGGADEYRAKLEDSMRSGVYLDPRHAAMSFREASDKYRAAQLSSKVSTTTIRDREFRSRVLPKWGERPLGSITRSDLEEWVSEMMAGTAPVDFVRDRADKSLGASGIKHVVQHVSGVYSYAMEHGWIARNPATGITLQKPPKTKHKYLTIPQVEILAQSAEELTGSRSDAVLVMLLAYCGLRIGESMALLVSDLDPTARRLSVTKTWADHHGTQTIDTPKNHKDRRVPVHGFLLPDLVALAEGCQPDDYLFRGARGGPLSTHNWRARVWKELRETTPFLAGLTPHDLRHTAASTAIAAGADVLVVQTMLGHSSATETLDTYAHLFPDRLDEVADAVEAKRRSVLDAAKPDPD